MYQTPSEYKVVFNHPRPRFKNDLENVLVYMASEISKIPSMNRDDFAEQLNQAVRRYPGNSEIDDDTMNNWRTEISALLGFVEHNGDIDSCGLRAYELAESGDLIKFFKTFLYTFQYPGAYQKNYKIKPLIKVGIRFKPAKHILQTLQFAEKQTGNREYITKAEVCHMLFNDLRVVRDNEPVDMVWERISQNRVNNVRYDSRGDVIRSAGDIIDYMVIANLLITYDNKRYYINTLENESVHKFVNSNEWFDGYDNLIEKCLFDPNYEPEYSDINAQYDNWFSYVNRNLNDTDFSTDIVAFLSSESDMAEDVAISDSQKYFKQLLESGADIPTKEIGDFGESLVLAHECARLRAEGADNVIHLVKRMPTSLALGYDINSREVDERHRYIEVKTTLSSKPIQLYRFHLTRNEWNAAETNRGQYFVYRLMVSKEEIKLFVISDPVGLYKKDVVNMIPTDGADIAFRPDTAGNYEELMS